MSASRKGVRAGVLLAAGVLFAGCSALLDFDESKIPGAEGSSGGSAEAGPGGGGVSSGGVGSGGLVTGGAGGAASGGIGADASSGGTGGSGGASGSGGAETGGSNGSGGATEPPPACDVDTNDGCESDELCCAVGQTVACKKTSTSECETCGVACAEGLTTACVSRHCECAPGSARACSGAESERFCATGVAPAPDACVGCRDATDCAGRTDGKLRCVAGQCAVCDPGNGSAGCAGKTPICDAATLTCMACTATPVDCTAPLRCTASGACGSCASAANCTTVTSPICDATSTECRPCANNPECVGQRGLPFCVAQTCSACHPTLEAGCSDPTKPDCRGDSTGGFSCQPCTNDGHCANRAGATACDTATGRCVACVDDADCSGNAKAPFCAGNVCVACDTVSAIAVVTDFRCALKPGGNPACIRNGTQKGACGACDPGGSRGCTADQLCCEASGVATCVATSLGQCAACTGGACDALLANSCGGRGCRCGAGPSCSGSGSTRFCTGTPAACEECRTDADCPSASSPLCSGGACVPCDQAGSARNARCATKAAGTVCAVGGALSGRCAACDPTSHAGCSGPLDQCLPQTATCVDCVDGSGCSGPLDQCDVAAHQCVDCVDDGGCSGTLDQCNALAHQCVDCDTSGGCDVATKPVCAGTTCRGCGSDAECAALPGSAGPLCGVSGACGPDAPCTDSAGCTDGIHVLCVGDGVDAGATGLCRAL